MTRHWVVAGRTWQSIPHWTSRRLHAHKCWSHSKEKTCACRHPEGQKLRSSTIRMQRYSFRPVDEPELVVSQVFRRGALEDERIRLITQTSISSCITETVAHESNYSSIRSLSGLGESRSGSFDAFCSEQVESDPTRAPSRSIVEGQDKARNLLWKMSVKRSLFQAGSN